MDSDLIELLVGAGADLKVVDENTETDVVLAAI